MPSGLGQTCAWGSPILQNNPQSLRISFLNVGCLPQHNPHPKQDALHHHIHNHHFDILGILEVGLNWSIIPRSSSSSETVVLWGRNNYFARHLLSRSERRDVTNISRENKYLSLHVTSSNPKRVGEKKKFCCWYSHKIYVC